MTAGTLGDVLRENSCVVPVDVETNYALSGVSSYTNGLFIRGPLTGGDTAYKVFHQLKAGQLVLSTLKGWEGAIALTTPEHHGRFVPPHNALFDFDTSRALPEFVFWGLRRPGIWAQLKDASRGMGARRETISSAKFQQLAFPIPRLNDQRQIVARLDGAAARVELALAGIREIDAELLQAARNVIWNAGARTNAWTPCGSFLIQRPLNVRVEPETDYPFAGVYSFGRGVFKSEVKRGSTFSYPALTRLRANDFVYPKLMAWEGALGVVPAECDGLVVSPEFPVFQIDSDQLLPIIVDTFFRDPRALPMLRQASSGTNMRRRRIHPSRFLELKIPVPPPEDQDLVAAILAKRVRILDHHRESLEDLNSILPAMLHEAFGASI